MAIDYALLIVTRWREGRGTGLANREAVLRASATGGRSVLFSGVTVTVSRAALALTTVPFLRCIGLAGLLIPLISVAVSATLLPVILDAVGPRLEWPRRKPARTVSPLATQIAQVVVALVINGPMVGGFNGDFDSASAHQVNTLAFDFAGVPAAQLAQLRTAVAQSAVSGPDGTYYSGQTTIAGHAYHWVDWASITVSGTAVAPQSQRQPKKKQASHAAGKAALSPVALTRMPSPISIAIASMPATATSATAGGGLSWGDLTAVLLPAALVATVTLLGLRRRRDRRA